MYISKCFKYVTPCIVLSALLSACNGGSSSTSVTGDADTYLFYASNNHINAINTANPRQPISVAAKSDMTESYPMPIYAGDYDAASHTVNNWQIKSVVYSKKDGKIYKASLLGGVVVQTQISNETQANQICNQFTKTTHSVITSEYFYRLPGNDGACSTADDIWKNVGVNMGASDTPLIFPHVSYRRVISKLADTTTGKYTGVLMHIDGALKHCDTNLTNCGAALLPISHHATTTLDIDQYNRRLLQIDDKLYIYNGQSNQLSAPVLTVSLDSYISYLTTDNQQIYFTYDKALYKLPKDGSSAATLLIQDASFIVPTQTSDTKVFYNTENGIKSINKTGGTPTIILPPNGHIHAVAGSRVYYQLYDENRNIVEVGWMNDDGSNAFKKANMRWAGATISTSIDLNKSGLGPHMSFTIVDNPQKLIMVGITEGGHAGQPVISFDAASGNEIALGTLPPETPIGSFYCDGRGNKILCTAYMRGSTELFYIDATKANSLTQVTNTPDENEYVIY